MRNLIKNTNPWLPPKTEIDVILDRIWESRQLSNDGEIHQLLEVSLCSYLGVTNLSLYSNCATALIAAVRGLGLTGSVVTTPFTFPATTHSLAWNGIEPIFVDVEPDTGNIDTQKIEYALKEDTTAILATHCYGTPCDVIGIDNIAKKHNLKVIYDAAHAFGVRDDSESILNFGNASVLSFHATKVFHTIEGGAIAFRSPELKLEFNKLKNHGLEKGGSDRSLGLNGKMSEIHAAFGLAQIPHIDRLIADRRETCRQYKTRLAEVPGLSFLETSAKFSQNAAYFPILVGEEYPYSRDDLLGLLRNDNIIARPYFWPLVTATEEYQRYTNAGCDDFPIAKKLANCIICLPIFAEMDSRDLDWVISRISKYGNRR